MSTFRSAEERAQAVAELAYHFWEERGCAQGSQRAILYGAAGHLEAAFQHLDRAIAVRDLALVYLAAGPQWDSIRGDPRFDDRLKQMTLPRAAHFGNV
jgi:hypothetical protein